MLTLESDFSKLPLQRSKRQSLTIIVDADAVIGDEFLKLHQLDSGNFAGAADGYAFLFKQSDRNFPQPVALVEGVSLGEAVGEIEGNLHGNSLAL